MPRLDRDGLNLFLSVTWADGGGAGGTEDTAQLVDIWFTAEQSNPRSWVQIPIKEVKRCCQGVDGVGGGRNGPSKEPERPCAGFMPAGS